MPLTKLVPVTPGNVHAMSQSLSSLDVPVTTPLSRSGHQLCLQNGYTDDMSHMLCFRDRSQIYCQVQVNLNLISRRKDPAVSSNTRALVSFNLLLFKRQLCNPFRVAEKTTPALTGTLQVCNSPWQLYQLQLHKMTNHIDVTRLLYLANAFYVAAIVSSLHHLQQT